MSKLGLTSRLRLIFGHKWGRFIILGWRPWKRYSDDLGEIVKRTWFQRQLLGDEAAIRVLGGMVDALPDFGIQEIRVEMEESTRPLRSAIAALDLLIGDDEAGPPADLDIERWVPPPYRESRAAVRQSRDRLVTELKEIQATLATEAQS